MSHFKFKGPALLVTRVGPANAQKQTHNRKGEGNTAPTNRGIWVFPKGWEDAFFYAHVWYRYLPKHLQDSRIREVKDEDARRALYREQDEKVREIARRMPPKTIAWDRGFYSHIGYQGQMGGWWYWENPKTWAEVARKHLYVRERWGENLLRLRYSSDHLELFLPM
jgi:hypothetical protein